MIKIRSLFVRKIGCSENEEIKIITTYNFTAVEKDDCLTRKRAEDNYNVLI